MPDDVTAALTPEQVAKIRQDAEGYQAWTQYRQLVVLCDEWVRLTAALGAIEYAVKTGVTLESTKYGPPSAAYHMNKDEVIAYCGARAAAVLEPAKCPRCGEGKEGLWNGQTCDCCGHPRTGHA